MKTKSWISLAKETYGQWSAHQAPRLGASVAFYSVLSFAPLLLLATAVIALVFDARSANGALVDEARQLMGDQGAQTVESLLKNAQKPSSGIFASVVAFLTLLFGASGVFGELRDALNLIWDAKPKDAGGFMGLIRQRIFSFGMVLSVGFLLLTSLMLSAALAYVGHSFGQILPVPPIVLQTLNFVLSFAVVTALFALMFKYVPAVKIPWRDVLIGAIATALLFTIGKFLLGLYLGKASVGSTYGAAGSLVAVIVWIYYSAQIFFFGAEFTHVYAKDQGLETEGATQASAAKPGEAQQPERKAETPQPVAVAAESAVSPDRMPVRENSALVVNQPSTAQVSPQTKRSLLLAIALGFVLGRFSTAAQGGKNKQKSAGDFPQEADMPH